ncbi:MULTISPECIES: amidohydrolase [unclassified Streptomyces]|uniref:amidohydrolase n=1 Tax=unclassified Streptomyces TaxID=2593676 RepID=UPI001F034511|nr:MULTISPECIES: amidohydrolase [unclassified Streptomyces]MCH0565937.1 amidohydrolase [Streptomyces sp. MUM 2J]MCH0569102.1 amidohydrolase [Streptomyces sp. MUM 136J]
MADPAAVARLTRELTARLEAGELTEFYEDLHRHPELSFREHRTAARLAQRLGQAGYEVTEGVAGTGVVAVLENGPGPVVWLRGDMDALPLQEGTGLPYASTVPGVMHACGHDLHVTWLVGAAAALAGARAAWSGTLVVVGQPAEESGGGAAAMVADGLHVRFPRPDVLFGQHVAPGLAGFYPHTPGLTLSASDDIDVVVFGVGGHGSRPESTVDPVVTAAYIVTRLQTVVSREVAAKEQAVLTVGQLHAGTRHNVIPDRARLGLNLRTQDTRTRERILAAVRRIVEGECRAAGCPVPPEVTVLPGYPSTVNDAALATGTAAVHRALFGEHTVFDFGPAMGSEDFSLLAPEGVPYDYWYVTSTPAAVWEAAPGEDLAEKIDGVPGNHSPLFAPDPSVVLPGVGTLVAAALSRLT